MILSYLMAGRRFSFSYYRDLTLQCFAGVFVLPHAPAMRLTVAAPLSKVVKRLIKLTLTDGRRGFRDEYNFSIIKFNLYRCCGRKVEEVPKSAEKYHLHSV